MAMVFLKVQTILTKMDRKIIYYINQSLRIFKRLLVLIKCLHEILKDCYERLSKLQLHLAIALPQNRRFIHNKRIRAKFKENCLIQDNMSCTYGNVVNSFLWIRYMIIRFKHVFNTKNVIQINVDTVVMILNLMDVHDFHCRMMSGVKMMLFLEVAIVLVCLS